MEKPEVFFRQNRVSFVRREIGRTSQFSTHILFEGFSSCDSIEDLDVPDLWMDL
jgi:hypothetical protein